VVPSGTEFAEFGKLSQLCFTEFAEWYYKILCGNLYLLLFQQHIRLIYSVVKDQSQADILTKMYQ
jgi:hypothetical protein